MTDKINKVISKIMPIDRDSIVRAKRRLDNLTKPQGSLGRIEDLAARYVSMTDIENPVLAKKYIFTLAADHGVTEEGISAYPKEVTAQMVLNFLRGGAGINVLARHVGAQVLVVDMGVAQKFAPNVETSPEIDRDSAIGEAGRNFVDKKINFGTKNFTKGPAMTKEEALRSIEAGIDVFMDVYSRGPVNIIGIGEMGIGNTTSSSAIVAAITKIDAQKVTGRGTGIDDETYKRKISVIEKAIGLNKPNPQDPIDVLMKIGGFEIGGLFGIVLASASLRVPVVLDGFISTTGAYLAYKLCPTVKEYIFASHNSVEIGHNIILKDMGLTPLFDLNLRLGEGTGAALGIGMIDASIKILTQMATFSEAGVSEKSA